MPSYPAGITVSSRALITLTDALRQRRTQRGTRWRRLAVGQQALLVLAHLRKGETYTDLAIGFGIGTITVFRDICEALGVLTDLAPTPEQAINVARRKAFAILDGTLLRIEAYAKEQEHPEHRRRASGVARSESVQHMWRHAVVVEIVKPAPRRPDGAPRGVGPRPHWLPHRSATRHRWESGG